MNRSTCYLLEPRGWRGIAILRCSAPIKECPLPGTPAGVAGSCEVTRMRTGVRVQAGLRQGPPWGDQRLASQARAGADETCFSGAPEFTLAWIHVAPTLGCQPGPSGGLLHTCQQKSARFLDPELLVCWSHVRVLVGTGCAWLRFLLCVGLGVVVGCAIRRFIVRSVGGVLMLAPRSVTHPGADPNLGQLYVDSRTHDVVQDLVREVRPLPGGSLSGEMWCFRCGALPGRNGTRGQLEAARCECQAFVTRGAVNRAMCEVSWALCMFRDTCSTCSSAGRGP